MANEDTQNDDQSQEAAESSAPELSPSTDSSAPAQSPDTDGPASPSEDNEHAGGENQLPQTGEEGGIVEPGTGAFAPAEKGDDEVEAGEGEVVLEATPDGHEYTAPVGADGESPVTPQNPPPKAVRV